MGHRFSGGPFLILGQQMQFAEKVTIKSTNLLVLLNIGKRIIMLIVVTKLQSNFGNTI